MSFPTFHKKHSEEAIFGPKQFLEYQRKRGSLPNFKTPRGVILCYDVGFMRSILEKNKASRVQGFNGEFYLLEDTEGTVGMIGGFGIGSPAAAAILEELIAIGVSRFISIGTAGALQKRFDFGDIILCAKSIRDEGTSHHYLPRSKYAHGSKEMTNEIRRYFEKKKIEYVEGTSWTIDAPYRETIAEVRKYQADGVMTVEMEASALFSVAEFRKVHLAAILTVSDSLAEFKWTPNFHHKKTRESLQIIYEAAKEILKD